jgi:DNA-binding protein YbaB
MSELNANSAKILALTGQMQAVLEGQLNLMNDGAFRATDAEKTVRVEMNGHQWLTSLKIEHGLLKQGAEVVAARVNEALQNAQKAAGAYNEVAGEQLGAMMDKLSRQMNLPF